MDKTLRIWNLYDYQDSDLKTRVKRNIYSKELERIIYIQDDDFSHFKTRPEPDEEEMMTQPPEDLEKQVRCLAISPDAKLISSGDQQGFV